MYYVLQYLFKIAYIIIRIIRYLFFYLVSVSTHDLHSISFPALVISCFRGIHNEISVLILHSDTDSCISFVLRFLSSSWVRYLYVPKRNSCPPPAFVPENGADAYLVEREQSPPVYDDVQRSARLDNAERAGAISYFAFVRRSLRDGNGRSSRKRWDTWV